ncbi:flagellin N-terminal helical domain-containing protein [Pelobacter propionicus]|uniref:Flagellin domain protein n=1 Tax=Pelobacter propionicus (strain DSM 2379 / NBRC 103807 / OttBd1) TaxID=338966 RepID=A1AUA4_PELPD|nr:flagellin [Pelobacter propionicus]ABL00925.1 flagellin domain protein [Pelobacter propionicus DSM 2379]
MANSISLTAGMRNNLLALQNTNKLMTQTQNRLSTGKKVNSALDNPTNFFAAQAHTNRASDLTNRKDAMSEAVQGVNAADAGITAITALIESAQGIASAALASASTTDRANYAVTYNELMGQINKLASDSGYRGTNFLTNDDLTVEFAPGTGDATLKIQGFTATSVGLSLQTVGVGSTHGTESAAATSAVNDTYGTDTDWDTSTIGDGNNAIKSSSKQLEDALSTLRSESSKLSANLSIVTTRQDFTDNMINTLKTGADNLTLADTNEEGANMLMLQTRQSLGTTSLSLASQAAQAVLQLF